MNAPKTKTQVMEYVIRGITRECFTHDGQGIFDVTAMRQRAHIIGELHSVYLEDIIPFILTERVIDEERVRTLSDASWQQDPAMCVVIPEQGGGVSHLMIDGHHRAMRRHLEGMDSIDMWMIPLTYVLRPEPGWEQHPALDWGDKIVDGKIVRRG